MGIRKIERGTNLEFVINFSSNYMRFICRIFYFFAHNIQHFFFLVSTMVFYFGKRKVVLLKNWLLEFHCMDVHLLSVRVTPITSLVPISIKRLVVGNLENILKLKDFLLITKYLESIIMSNILCRFIMLIF